MNPTSHSGCAPGKIILLGEHAVVYGHPAIAIPVTSRSATSRCARTQGSGACIRAPQIGATWTPGATDSRLAPLGDMLLAMRDELTDGPVGIEAHIESTVPLGAGMGSGAAVAVALARALAALLAGPIAADDVIRFAMIAERGFHGNPSGVDVQVTARAEPVYFTREGGPEPLAVGGAFHFLVANTGVVVRTADVVGDVGSLRNRQPERVGGLFESVERLTRDARDAVETGDLPRLGALMNRAHDDLCGLTVSSDAVDRLVDAARTAGALGAKLSGAGRGGNIIALVETPDDLARVAEACAAAGAGDTCTTSLTPHAAEVSP